MRDLFNQTIAEIGVTIRTGDADGRLGFYDYDTTTIEVNQQLQNPHRYAIFMHEAFHAVEHAMKDSGTIRRRVPHAWIESAATNLFILLALGGFLNGVTPDEALAFADEINGPGPQPAATFAPGDDPR